MTLDPFHAWMNEQVERASDPHPPFTLPMNHGQASALVSAAWGAAGFHEAVLVAPLIERLARELGADDGPPEVDAVWEFRVIWQRQGMQRPRSKLFQTERGARRLVDKLSGKLFESDERKGTDYWCCDSRLCNCGGVTIAERVAADHAAVPPMVFGPVIEARPAGPWAVITRADPDPREPWPTDESGTVVEPAVANATPTRVVQEADYDIPF